MASNIRGIHSLYTILLFASALFCAAQARAFFSEPERLPSNEALASRTSLQTSVRIPKAPKSVIKFAVFGGKAKLYVNGKKQKTKPGSLKKVVLSLNNNDVVTFKCSKTGAPTKMAGLMASITHNGKIYRTGVERFTTRGGFSKWNTWEKQSWDKVKIYKDKSGKTHDFCHWNVVDKISSNWKKFDEKASFVWRLSGKQNKEAERSVFIRFVVGGEMCSGGYGNPSTTGGAMKDSDDDEGKDDNGSKRNKGSSGGKKNGDKEHDDEDGKGQKKKDNKDDDEDEGEDSNKGKKKPSRRVPHPKEDTDTDDDEESNKGSDDSQLGGQSDDAKPDQFCACQLTTRRGGECYDMEDPNASSGRCKPRRCEPKFECVASSDKMCVKRRGGIKVVMVSPNKCETEPADDIEMLLPYDG
eukprot:TRINITY_DN1468_c1_g1_i1.p1 TRINITY_DN1468_c1_g1~~TRINITY_DN1468_c1_g1_i1.p1  ORF type:complete len:412 (+),score=82.15 TRINITY_DN1468_c1_g1_i1:2416-3651(+)